ncbi:MAG: dihydrodipicolinate synthase family protein [Fuerstiella sp.]
MNTDPISPSDFRRSVLAVPPLARDTDFKVCPVQNRRLIQHIERGGVDMLLYGGNANFYHMRPSEYESTLEILASSAADGTRVIPAVGPAYGTMMDQADILKRFNFSTVMVLPTTAVMTEPGLMNGFRDFVQSLGQPAVLYIKDDNYMSPEGAAELVENGDVSFIKYAIVKDDPADDEYLKRLVELVDPSVLVSGIGEQPAMIHLTKFRCGGFTSGCVCVNPALSQQMLNAIHDNDYNLAEKIRKIFVPLEDLRNEVNPIRVLHEAVSLSGIADVGPHVPLLSGLTNSKADEVKAAATALLNVNL